MMFVSLNCVHEEKPGNKWKDNFDKSWPFYKKWYLIEGHLSRPGYLTCVGKIKEHMPELHPVYEQLVELVGGSDIAARYISMYCPPPYMSGCTQLAWSKNTLALIRNYDYNPKLFEGMMLYSNWLQPVMGISDCNWGLLDGMNGSGLAASLTFGGRKVTGRGFGIPLVMRYVLETCGTVQMAIEKLRNIPVHMAYNITLVDKEYDYATVYLSPDRDIIITRDQIGTNHQQTIEWYDYAVMTATKERMEYLKLCLADPKQTEETILKSFFRPPLYHINFDKAFVTLYTSVYHPVNMTATIYWPKKSIVQSFENFSEQKKIINISKAVTSKFTK